MVARVLNRGLRATIEASCVVRIPNANIYRFGDPNGARPVRRAVDWAVREGESWAVKSNAARELRYTDTGAWFVNGPTLSEWKDSGPSSLLWIHGKRQLRLALLFRRD